VQEIFKHPFGKKNLSDTNMLNSICGIYANVKKSLAVWYHHFTDLYCSHTGLF